MGRFLIETHLRTGRPIKELAEAHEVSASWLFKLLRRYRLDGPEGLAPRSRRPRRSPTRIADRFEDEIVALHKQLADDGLDAGAQTIQYHLAQRHRRPRRPPPSFGCSRPGALSPSSPRSARRALCTGSAPLCPTSAGRP